MGQRLYLTSATLVLPHDVVADGSVLVEDGVISAVCPTRLSGPAEEVNLRGAWLLPGLIDLHNDAVECEAMPRPTAPLPLPFAIQQADRICALGGITTVYHALSFAGEELGLRNNQQAETMARLIADYAPGGLVEHRVHCRYELTEAEALPLIESLIDEQICTLVSLMDHTPGQGQFRDLETYRNYFMKTHQTDGGRIDEMLARKLAGLEGMWERMQHLAAKARSAGIPLASHDDDAIERVESLQQLGISLSEFPLNEATAARLAELQIPALVGSPNILRGGSQLRNMRALDLIAAGYANCLCSDYAPATLLPAVFRVSEELDWSLDRAVALATANPAAAVGLTDRGSVAVGLRADLLAVTHQQGHPAVAQAWHAGREIFRMNLANQIADRPTRSPVSLP